MSGDSGRNTRRVLFSVGLLACVLLIVFQSWSSTSSLALTLSSTWSSVVEGGDSLVLKCSEGSKDRWHCDCTLWFRGETQSFAMRASPLVDGGFYWVSKENNPYFSLYMEGGKLVLQLQNSRGKVESFAFTRVESLMSASTITLLRRKSKYIVALFVLIGSYKCIFGKPRLTREARLAELRKREAERRRAVRKVQ